MPVPKHYSPPPVPEASPPTARVLSHLLELNPDNADIFAALGTVYLRSEMESLAVENLRSALKLRPEMSKMRTNLGIALRMLKEETEAESQFREALLHDPKLEIATLQLVEILIKRSEHENALKMLERTLLNKASTDLSVRAGICADALGQSDKARSYFEKAVQDADPVALAWLAEFDCKQGRELILAGSLVEGIEVLFNAYNRAPVVFTGDTKTVALLDEISNLDTSNFSDGSNYIQLLRKFLKLGIVWEVFSKEESLEKNSAAWEEGIKKRGTYPYGYYRLGIIQAFQEKFMESLDSLDICRAQLPVKKQMILKLAEVVDAISEVRDKI